MNRTKQRLHRSACFSFMLLALFLIKTNIGYCAAPILSWTDEAGLWNDGVTPDYGPSTSPNSDCLGEDTPHDCCTGAGTCSCTADTYTFKVIYTDSDNNAPYAGYPKVHILKDGTAISGSPFTMAQEIGCGLPYCGDGYANGEQYYYTTTLSSVGNYTYYFDAMDSNSETASTGPSPTREHTLTVVDGYVWVDS